jgi:dephospho-CoA kinase
MVIGITGLIGAGKSEAARLLASYGACVVDADQIGHEVLKESSVLRRQLVKAFSPDILDRQGRVERKKLAARAFVSDQTKDILNRLVHPYLLRELRRQVAAAKKQVKVVVIDAALLLYWKMDREVDFTLVIHAGREARHARMAARGISLTDAAAREKAQLPYSEFKKRADRLILNNGTRDDLERKLSVLWKKLQRMTPTKRRPR